MSHEEKRSIWATEIPKITKVENADASSHPL
jgi:hypothetical protein